MPIYAYRCDACGHTKDVLQKVSDPLLTRCPACGAEAFQKQLTAAGFQLKGSGWYVTDFRGDNAKKAAAAGKDDAANGDAAKGDAKPAKPAEADGAKTTGKAAASTPASTGSADKTAAASPNPAGTSGAATPAK